VCVLIEWQPSNEIEYYIYKFFINIPLPTILSPNDGLSSPRWPHRLSLLSSIIAALFLVGCCVCPHLMVAVRQIISSNNIEYIYNLFVVVSFQSSPDKMIRHPQYTQIPARPVVVVIVVIIVFVFPPPHLFDCYLLLIFIIIITGLPFIDATTLQDRGCSP